ncbi:response regulator [Rubrobacter marinus]|nr:response regulator [Rubrobacter marinus]
MGTERKTVRVLVVEDHAAFRQALAVVLGARPDLEATAQAGSLAEARACLSSGGAGPFDAAVVDLGLPDGDGTELVGELVDGEPAVPVLALTDRLDLDRRGKAVRAGAQEVLSKGAGLGVILDAIRRLGARRR